MYLEDGGFLGSDFALSHKAPARFHGTTNPQVPLCSHCLDIWHPNGGSSLIRIVQETSTWLPPEVVGKSLWWKISCTSDLNVASLRTSCHDIRRWHASFQRREVTNSPTQPRCLRTITVTCEDQQPKACSSSMQTLALTAF